MDLAHSVMGISMVARHISKHINDESAAEHKSCQQGSVVVDFFWLCVLLNGKKQKARPKGVNLKVRWRAKVAMR